MFYLLTRGGASKCDPNQSVTGIGYLKAALIWWDVLANSTAATDYIGMRQKYIAAAALVYGAGSLEVASVQDAFAAVGLP